MNDDPRNEHSKGLGDTGPLADGPAQWARREEGTVDMDAGAEGAASYNVGETSSLDSKLRGGGQDQSADAGESTRLCPACSTVTVFVDGKCTNCEYMVGTSAHEGVQEIRQAFEGEAENPLTKFILIIAIALVVIVLLAVGIPRLLAGRNQADTVAETTTTADLYNTDRSFAGALDEVPVDDALHADVRDAFLAANAGWESEEVDAYVYRYKIISSVEQATSQNLRISAFVGGDNAHEAVSEAGKIPLTLGTADMLDRLNSRPGVEASIRLYNTEGEEEPGQMDEYIRYGYYYGLEHMDQLEPLIENLDSYRIDNGEYPHVLSDKVMNSRIKTKKGFFFVPEGIGYLPVFRTDSSGNIVIGTGSGMASLQPEKCTGYYLFMYTRDPDDGLDLHDKAASDYYVNKIAPFPYATKSAVKNVELIPDGKPDGIACVVKDGRLVKD